MDNNKQVGETSSSEVANRFRSCRDLSDIVPLYPPRSLYLKPLAKVNVSVNLPQLKTPGKTISTWEVMEKVRALILPDEFASLKVAKSTLEFIRLEGDLRDRCRLPRVLARLDLQRLKLAGFASVLKVRAAETKDDFPTRHNWDSYFRDAKHMNELKAGERPDTIHISGLPVKWFTEEGTETPSEALITKIFSKWGTLRRVDVPAADPYRSRMRLGNNIHKFSYEEGIYFDVYVQYMEYMDFVRAMDAMRGMKLMKKDGQNSLTATIKVDFDKTKHMNDNSVSHRNFERKRLIAQDNLAAEKLRKKEEAEKKRREELKKKEEAETAAKTDRQQNREEKRKRKALKMFRKQEEDKVSMKIAREEQKLTRAQRQLESIRLLDELFDRIKNKVEKKEIKLGQNMNAEMKKDEKKSDQANESASKLDSENDKKNKKEDVKKKKVKKEKKKKKKRKKMQKKRKKDDDSGSESTSEDLDEEADKKKLKSVLTQNNYTSSSTDATLPYADAYDPMQMLRIPMHRYPAMSPGMQVMRIPMSKYPGAQMLRGSMARYHYPMRRGRRYFPRCDVGSYALTNPYLYNEDYYEYFTHIVNQDSKRRGSKPRRKSMSRSASRTKSSSKTRTRSSSRSRSRRRSGSRSRRKSRSNSRSRSRSRRKSTSRSNSRRRSRTRSESKTKRKSATRSRSRRRSGSRSRRRSTRSESRSKTHSSRSKRKSRSRSRSRSRGSFRNRYRRRHDDRSPSIKITRAKSPPKRKSRSSSWSLPRSPRRSSSWSTFEATISEDINKKSNAATQEEPAKTAEAQKEEVTNQQDLKI